MEGATGGFPFLPHVGTTSVVPYNKSFEFNVLCASVTLWQK
jgi:hypothetical protein